MATSVTVRPIGPPMSCVLDSGMIPVRLASPCVPRMPTRLLCEAGMRIDPQVSLPIPTAAKFAAMAAPVPPLEPPGLRSSAYGLRVWPNSEPSVVIPRANSCMFDLAMTMTPASRSFLTRTASVPATHPASAREPSAVCMVTVS